VKAPAVAAQPAVAKPVAASTGPITTATLEARFNGQVKPLLVKHCYSCHGNGKHKGDLSLDPYTTLVSVQSSREQWGHIAEVMRQKLMPPEEKPQPTQAEFDALVGWVNDALAYCDCSGPRDPGPGGDPPAEPDGVQQHDPRPARGRLQAGQGLPGRRHRVRVRQHRRRADDVARCWPRSTWPRPSRCSSR
jgi:mono/diheme cytochrome c family protein